MLLAQPSLIDGISSEAIAVREFVTGIGPADLVVVDTTGALTVIECKLATNSDIRREVVGQVLHWSSGPAETSLAAFADRWSARRGPSLDLFFDQRPMAGRWAIWVALRVSEQHRPHRMAVMSHGPAQQSHQWPSAPRLDMPVRPRRNPVGWWIGYAVSLAMGVLGLMAGHDLAIQVRQIDAEDALAELTGQTFIGFMGMAMTTAAASAFVAATVIAAIGMRGPARWVAPALSGVAALGSLALLGSWFLGWLF